MKNLFIFSLHSPVGFQCKICVSVSVINWTGLHRVMRGICGTGGYKIHERPSHQQKSTYFQMKKDDD